MLYHTVAPYIGPQTARLMMKPRLISCLLFFYRFIISSSAASCGKSGSPEDEFFLPEWLSISNSRIIGGTTVEAHKWPWLAQIFISRRFQCGGALIDPNYVVTAAHCYKKRNMSEYDVLLGDNYLGRGSRHLVTHFVIHDLYNFGFAGAYDIAIVKIEPPAEISNRIRPICLPTLPVPVHQICVVAGWGTEDENVKIPSKTLKEINIPILPPLSCMLLQKYIGRIHLPSMICAGDGVKDACLGDSGGPLMCLFNGRWEVQGIVSWGFGCGHVGEPGVYSSVHSALPFINAQMWRMDIMA